MDEHEDIDPLEPTEKDLAFSDLLESVILEAAKELELIGVMPTDVSLGVLPKFISDPSVPVPPDDMGMKDAFDAGLATAFASVTAELTSTAFSDRVLSPENHEVEKGLRLQLPTEEEAGLSAMLEDLASDGFTDDL